MQVYVKLKPAGDVQIAVNLPEKFYKVIMDIAQTAADNHEALCKAELLAETTEQREG